MNKCAANCPFCDITMKISQELINQIVICPNCKEEVCFAEEDLVDIAEAERRSKISKNLEIKENKRAERSKTEYRFLILKFDEIETTLNYLWYNEGWQVVSQSTVFLSETSAGIGGFSGATKVEGIAYTLKREKSI